MTFATTLRKSRALWPAQTINSRNSFARWTRTHCPRSSLQSNVVRVTSPQHRPLERSRHVAEKLTENNSADEPMENCALKHLTKSDITTSVKTYHAGFGHFLGHSNSVHNRLSNWCRHRQQQRQTVENVNKRRMTCSHKAEQMIYELFTELLSHALTRIPTGC